MLRANAVFPKVPVDGAGELCRMSGSRWDEYDIETEQE